VGWTPDCINLVVTRARVAAVAAYLPPIVRTNREVEALIAAASPDFRVSPDVIGTVTGVQTRRVASDGTNSSDLAVEACRRALEKSEVSPREVDLLIFAAGSQDFIEPATANVVQRKLGATCPVFDLKNACNSFLNGLQVASALIQAGSYRRVLVAVGETPSRCIRWAIPDRREFKLSFPSYTLGDAGAAALLVPSDDERGIFYSAFQSATAYWDLAMLPGGGSMHPRGDEYLYFRGDGARLKEALAAIGPGILQQALTASGTTYDDYARILIHQVTNSFLDKVLAAGGLPRDKVVVTLPEYGNMVAASLPVAFSLAEERGEIRPGDRVLWFGQASGISLGVVLMQW
jgi:3-oxoacyl-(acyl-carrier-protein) synthase III